MANTTTYMYKLSMGRGGGGSRSVGYGSLRKRLLPWPLPFERTPANGHRVYLLLFSLEDKSFGSRGDALLVFLWLSPQLVRGRVEQISKLFSPLNHHHRISVIKMAPYVWLVSAVTPYQGRHSNLSFSLWSCLLLSSRS
jgi:hypothetical protein